MLERREVNSIVKEAIVAAKSPGACTHMSRSAKLRISVIMKESQGPQKGPRKTHVKPKELLVFIFIENISGEVRYKLKMIAGEIFARNFDVNNLGTYLLMECKKNLVIDERAAIRELVLSIANSV
jgi:hypothetical protein